MSRDLYVYKTRKLKEKEFDDVINIDENPLGENYDYIDVDRAEPWIKKYGKKVLITGKRIDWDKAQLDYFGKKCNCRQFLYDFNDDNYGYRFIDENNNVVGELRKNKVEKDYTVVYQKEVYVYYIKRLFYIDSYYFDNPKDGPISKSQILSAVRAIINKGDCYYHDHIATFMKMYFYKLKKDERLIVSIG